MEKKLYNLTYVNDPVNPWLQESIEDVLAYSDGDEFNLDNRDAYLGGNVLRGPCFALAMNDGLAMRDYKCSRELGTICLWKGNVTTSNINYIGLNNFTLKIYYKY